MVVDDPIKVTLTNWPEGQVEWYDCPLNPADPEGASRKVPFTGELLIDRADFMEDAPKKFFRLKPDGEVRLKYTYIIKCNEVIKDDNGRVVELKCTYDPSTRPGSGEWRSVKGTIHWVSTAYMKEVELRKYDRLFTLADMSQVPEDKDYKDFLNPESLVVVKGYAEPALLEGVHAMPQRIVDQFSSQIQIHVLVGPVARGQTDAAISQQGNLPRRIRGERTPHHLNRIRVLGVLVQGPQQALSGQRPARATGHPGPRQGQRTAPRHRESIVTHAVPLLHHPRR